MNIRIPSFRLRAAVLAGSLLALSACATTGYSDPYYDSASTYGSGYYGNGYATTQAYGTVESVRQVTLRGDTSGVGAGAVLGAIVGGAIGNQIGDGNGRTAATVAGAVAGGLVGDRIQDSRNGSGRAGLEVVVRLDNGQRITVVQDMSYRLYSGQRVKLTGSGSAARIVPL